MWKKIAINVFYNVGLVLSIIGIGWAFNNNKWLIVAFCAATFAAFLFFKMQLLKQVRNEMKK